MLICLRDFESHCFQGYREHKHNTKCPLPGTWRWWQCGLRAELRLCESWAMKEPRNERSLRVLECLNQEKHCLLESWSSPDLTCLMMPFELPKLPFGLFLQSRSSQSMSKLQIWHAEEEWAQATGRQQDPVLCNWWWRVQWCWLDSAIGGWGLIDGCSDQE